MHNSPVVVITNRKTIEIIGIFEIEIVVLKTQKIQNSFSNCPLREAEAEL